MGTRQLLHCLQDPRPPFYCSYLEPIEQLWIYPDLLIGMPACHQPRLGGAYAQPRQGVCFPQPIPFSYRKKDTGSLLPVLGG